MKNLIIGDGAMGTELRRRGVEVPSHVESIWSALALKEATSIVEEIHIDYIEAGSDYITTNNYAVTRPILSRDNLDNELESLTIKSIEIANAALSKTKRENVKILGSLPPLETSYRADLILKEKEILSFSKKVMEEYDVRPRSPNLITSNFSGGNQQKIILSRELNENPKVLLVGQPTRGVDIGAIEFIHQRLIDMRDKGAAILLVSVELEEVLSLSDRIVVMFDGNIVGEKINKDVTDRELGLLMAGVA